MANLTPPPSADGAMREQIREHPKEVAPSRFVWLIAVFVAGLLLVVGLKAFFSHLHDELGAQSANEQARLFIGEEIVRGIQGIERDVYLMATLTSEAAQIRQEQEIIGHADKLEKDLKVLKEGGTVRRIIDLNIEGHDQMEHAVRYQPTERDKGYVLELIEVAPLLAQIKEKVKDLRLLLGQRMALRESQDMVGFFQLEHSASLFLKHLPPTFQRLNENANRLYFESSQRLDVLESQIAEQRERYQFMENLLIVLVVVLATLASVVFTNQIRDSNHRLRMAWEEMHEAKEEAERASRAKSAFVSRMSHELRTPMNAILGFSQLLEEEELKPEQKDFVLEINRAGVHLLELINQVLDLAKIEAGSMTLENIPFDPTQMVEQVATLIGEQARARELELRLEVSPDLPGQILGDPTRLRQVLINLAGNALKFTHQGGIDLRVALVEEGNRIEYSVRDSGIGMDAETLARLFRPFSQADESVTRKFGGTGLGLSIARDLVRAMGGEIHVESESGQGSRFWFSLPAVRAAEEFADNHSAGLASAPITEPVPLSENAGGTSEPSELAGHVLLVEDNNINQIIASRMLERLGLTHEIANNGREALEKIQAHTYDLILMDVQMPEMDGMDATRALRAWEIENARPRLPVIAMTANALSGDRSDCLASGMDDHLAKPVRVETLRALLAHWLPKQAGP